MPALAVLDEPTTKLPTLPASNQLDHQLQLLFEEIGDRVNRIRYRLDQGEPPDQVLDDLVHLLMAASMTSPTTSPMRALANEAAIALLYAAGQPETDGDLSLEDH